MQKDLDTTRCSDAEPASPTVPSVVRVLTGGDIERLAYLRLHHSGVGERGCDYCFLVSRLDAALALVPQPTRSSTASIGEQQPGCGTRVVAFDPSLFVNDRDTPLTHTMRAGTVVGERTDEHGRRLVDIRFDHRPTVSHGHFADRVKRMPPTGLVSPGSASNTDAPRQNDIDDNWLSQNHHSDKAWAMRNGGQRED